MSNMTVKFELSLEQQEKLNKFVTEHHCTVKYCGPASGMLEYRFLPTNKGMDIKVICACENRVSLTDFSQFEENSAI